MRLLPPPRHGQQFGRLRVLLWAPIKGRTDRWTCLCDCGEETVAVGSHLDAGGKASCGCLQAERRRAANTTHGDTVNRRIGPEYRAWSAMKTRCYNANYPSYSYYGGRGIKVCDRWLNDFAAFREDMGRRPSKRHSLDRIDPDGDYEPGNCRWATAKTQTANQRRGRAGFMEHNRRNAHIRWHVNRGVTNPECEFCQETMNAPHSTRAPRMPRQ